MLLREIALGSPLGLVITFKGVVACMHSLLSDLWEDAFSFSSSSFFICSAFYYSSFSLSYLICSAAFAAACLFYSLASRCLTSISDGLSFLGGGGLD